MSVFHIPPNPLFGQTETLQHSINESFRRLELVGARHQRAAKLTGEHTLAAALDRQNKVHAAPASDPQTWREAWLQEAPTMDELLLATHAGKIIDPQTVSEHIEDRRLKRQRRANGGGHRAPPPPPPGTSCFVPAATAAVAADMREISAAAAATSATSDGGGGRAATGGACCTRGAAPGAAHRAPAAG